MEKKITTEMFIERSVKRHSNRYDYSKTLYKNTNTKLEIICRIHGSFLQLPSNHTKGAGCIECGKITAFRSRKPNSNLFFKRAKEIHKDFYDYSKVEYKNSKTKIIIGCPIHGYFSTTPTIHLQRKGCPACGKERNMNKESTHSRSGYISLAKNRLSKLYLIRCFNEEEEFYKIGKTLKKINKRFVKSNLPYKFETVFYYEQEAGFIWDLEVELHRKYKKQHYLPKLKFAGYTECYKIDLPIKEIISL